MYYSYLINAFAFGGQQPEYFIYSQGDLDGDGVVKQRIEGAWDPGDNQWYPLYPPPTYPDYGYEYCVPTATTCD